MAMATQFETFFWISSLRSFSAWNWAEIVAGFCVAIGCIGEMYWLFVKGPRKEEWLKYKEFEDKKTHREKLFAIVVAIGVTAELICLMHSLPETIRLSGSVEQLTQTNITMATKLEDLRKANLELEAKVQPRRITTDQRAVLVGKLLPIKDKCRIVVSANLIDPEAILLAQQIRDVLRESQFPTELETPLMLPWIKPEQGKTIEFGQFFFFLDPSPLGANEVIEEFSKFFTFKKMLMPSKTNELHLEIGSKPLP